MGLFKRKSDPISERSRSLNAEIAALEKEIKQLNSKLEHEKDKPRLRSTALPGGERVTSATAQDPAREPIFEPLEANGQSAYESGDSPGHYNDLGVRKYDLVAAWHRLQNNFSGPPSNNSKLVNYLAAGSIKGLRPLRYEKRIARNRFIALFVVLFLLLLGIVSAFVRNY